MARLTLLIGMSGSEIDCPVNTRKEADDLIETLRTETRLVRLPGISYIKASHTLDMGSRGVICVHPAHIQYTQILGVDE